MSSQMTAPIRSMTGFARVHKATEHGEITVTLKSVNHRGLDLHFHLEADLDPFEGPMRALLKRSIFRGHIDIRCTLLRSGNGGPGGLNAPLLRAYLAAFRQAAAAEGITSQPDLNQALRLPGMFGFAAGPEPDPKIEDELLGSLQEAVDKLNQFRSREGAELAAFIREHNRALADSADQMERIRSRAQPAFQSRLTEKLQDLLRPAALDPQRIAQEAALLADRSDIGEEISRLQIHSRQLNQILDAGGEVGKKIDFLLQEMNRETNTVLSKTNGIGELGLGITDLALAGKAAIEKIREQALNLE
jgi:uncharacterized protein (TIGR00255 family)